MIGVRIRVLDVPEMAQVGHTVHLLCDYDLERQSLYQVKWYKGSHEFYRYSPGEHIKKKTFLVKNLHVDVRLMLYTTRIYYTRENRYPVHENTVIQGA